MKSQFQSGETLKIRISAFVSSASGAYIMNGTDTCTIAVRKPDGSSQTFDGSSTPAVLWDSVVKMWTLDIPTSSYLQGEWKVYAVSNSDGALPKWAVYQWGDYVDDIGEVDLSPVTSALAAVSGDIADLLDVAFGRWKVQGTQLILYRQDDDEVPWKAFDLYDDSGSSSGVRVFERRLAP